MSYDVFISFKNSGKDGKATPDAKAARSVYEALKAEKIKVFFSGQAWYQIDMKKLFLMTHACAQFLRRTR